MLHMFCMWPMKKNANCKELFNKAFRASLISPRGAQTLTRTRFWHITCAVFSFFLFGKSLKLRLVIVWLNFLLILLPQGNGWACVDFGCTHPIDGLFWSLPIYLLGFFSKQECLGNWFNHASYHFILVGLSLAFLYHKVSCHYDI